MSRNTTTNLLVQATHTLPTALVLLPATLIATPARPTAKTFPIDRHPNPPITVGTLPVSTACAECTWPPNGSSPNSFQVRVNGFASQLPEGRSLLTSYSKTSHIHRSPATVTSVSVVACAVYRSTVSDWQLSFSSPIYIMPKRFRMPHPASTSLGRSLLMVACIVHTSTTMPKLTSATLSLLLATLSYIQGPQNRRHYESLTVPVNSNCT